ncbi:hypothetical protein, partial [Sedimentibacter sp. B4]|uniref:hypothetical protein n=1 Tax=Sedimentibacter sp. B4 TaxID=304766 RepID=UPI0018DE3ED3
VSSPALSDGTAYVGRLGLAAQMFATEVAVTLGYVNTQFVHGELSVLASVQALAHIAAPAAIVKADLT